MEKCKKDVGNAHLFLLYLHYIACFIIVQMNLSQSSLICYLTFALQAIFPEFF